MRWSRRQDLWPSRKNGGKPPQNRVFMRRNAEGKVTRFIQIAALSWALTGCAVSVPESGAPGAGFGALGRENASPLPDAQALSDESLSANPANEGAGAEDLDLGGTQDPTAALALETQAVLAATQAQADGAAEERLQPVINAAGISQENDFDAVGSQRSIEDDAARRAALQQQYQVVAATKVPARVGSGGPNIVAYALSTSNARGEGIYKRSGLNLQAKSTRNCARYASPDLAQLEFLERGGPERDRLALDPDGDGYACSWDPAPFRAARAAGAAQAAQGE